jgi:hypothetical protein
VIFMWAWKVTFLEIFSFSRLSNGKNISFIIHYGVHKVYRVERNWEQNYKNKTSV